MAAQEALGLTEGLSDIGQQFDRQEQELAQKTQDRFGGGHVSGGTYALDRRRQDAARRLMQDSAQRGMQMAAREADQAMKYSQFDRTIEHQRSMREMEIAARRELQQLEAAQRQLDRELREKLANATNDLQRERLRNDAKYTEAGIRQRAKLAQEQIAASRFRRGAGGGGGRMGVSYSTGATGFEDHLRRMGVMS